MSKKIGRCGSATRTRNATRFEIQIPQTRRRDIRGGFLSLELVIALPILGIVLMGLFEFSLLFFARGDVVEASRVGARVATLPGVTAEDVQAEMMRVLNPQLSEYLDIDVELGERTGDVVTATVYVPMMSAAPDLLWPIGFSLQDRYLIAETRMIKE